MGNGYPHSTIAQILEDIIDQLSFEGESHSNIADILLSILNQTSYDKEPYSVLAELFLKLKAKIEGVPFDPYDKETHSVIADILVSILNETEYTDVPQSRIAELLLELKEELESYTEITVSGPIVSFTTNVSKPLVKLKADVNPVQDLHGYDHPWAGGAGTNKWDEETELGIYNSSTGEKKPSTTQLRSKNFVAVLPNTTYFFQTATATDRVLFYDTNKDYLNDSLLVTVGTFTTPANCYYVAFHMGVSYGTTYRNNVSINYPTTNTSYAPYENICPITGWSGANVTRTGANVWDEEWRNGYYTNGVYTFLANYVCSKNPIEIKPNTTYYALNGEAQGRLVIAQYDINGDFISNILVRNASFTTDSKAYSINFYLEAQLQSYNNNVSINYPSTDTAYHPFVGNTYTISFGDTYYGGELDVTNGVLRVTHKMVRITTVDSIHGDGKGARITISPTASGYTLDTNHFYCNMLKPSNYSTAYDNHVHFANAAIVAFYFSEVIGTTKAEWETYLANNELQLCYELTTPFTVQLTPQQIEQLEENNIWADTGDVEVTYIYKGTPET